MEMKGLVLKNIEVGVEYFKLKKQKVYERQVMSILDVLKNAKNKIPQISLI